MLNRPKPAVFAAPPGTRCRHIKAHPIVIDADMDLFLIPPQGNLDMPRPGMFDHVHQKFTYCLKEEHPQVFVQRLGLMVVFKIGGDAMLILEFFRKPFHGGLADLIHTE